MPIDVEFSILIAYIKWQLGIANEVSVIKVKVTVATCKTGQLVCSIS